MDNYYIEDLESAFIDLLDGNSDWFEIQYKTGLSDDRCKEISKMFEVVNSKYKQRHGIR